MRRTTAAAALLVSGMLIVLGTVECQSSEPAGKGADVPRRVAMEGDERPDPPDFPDPPDPPEPPDPPDDPDPPDPPDPPDDPPGPEPW